MAEKARRELRILRKLRKLQELRENAIFVKFVVERKIVKIVVVCNPRHNCTGIVKPEENERMRV